MVRVGYVPGKGLDIRKVVRDDIVIRRNRNLGIARRKIATRIPEEDAPQDNRRIMYSEELIGKTDLEYSTDPATQSSARRAAEIAKVDPFNRSAFLDQRADTLRQNAFANIR